MKQLVCVRVHKWVGVEQGRVMGGITLEEWREGGGMGGGDDSSALVTMVTIEVVITKATSFSKGV